MDINEKAREALLKIYGYHAYRPGQQELVEGLLSGKDALGVMPTGSGKSLCYQIPALLLPGVTLVISPLISLMKDQVTALKLRGLPAAYLNSSMDDAEYQNTVYQAAGGAYKLIYVAPERLQAPGFQDMCRRIRVSLVAVDEAHCISQWGQDFRPSYLKIPEFFPEQRRNSPRWTAWAFSRPDATGIRSSRWSGVTRPGRSQGNR